MVEGKGNLEAAWGACGSSSSWPWLLGWIDLACVLLFSSPDWKRSDLLSDSHQRERDEKDAYLEALPDVDEGVEVENNDVRTVHFDERTS